MAIVDYFKDIFNRIKTKRQTRMLLDSPEDKYDDLIKHEKIDNIITNIPQDLTETEKALCIYVELGKILNEDPRYILNDEIGKIENYNNRINTRYYGICKSISELYASVLKDERIGIDADIVKKHVRRYISHVDTILKTDEGTYIANLIGDLSRIKASRRLKWFGFDLSKVKNKDFTREEDNDLYLKRLEKYYGKIDYLPDEEIEKMNQKIGYSYSLSQDEDDEQKVMYTEDVVDVLKKEMSDKKLLKKYVLQDKDIPKEDILKKKLDYIFKNIDKITEFNADMKYIESIRHYWYLFGELLSKKEKERIVAYAATKENDLTDIIAIIKLKPLKANKDEKNNNNVYYEYSPKAKKYIEKTPEEIKERIDSLNKDELTLIETFNQFSRTEIDELEL